MRVAPAALLVALTLTATPAVAHAPPYGLALFFGADASSPTVLTNRGLIFADDAGFRLRCNEAYSASTAEDTLGFAAGGRIVVRGYAGVFASDDGACTFTRAEGLTEDSIGAFARTADGARVAVSSLNYEATSGLMSSSDGARSFDTLSALPLGSVIESMLFAPSRAQRLYAGGARYDEALGMVLSTWLVSDDGGLTFSREDVTSPRKPLGVHPTNADIVFVGELVDDLVPASRVLRSTDGGRTFTPLFDTTTALAFASTADARHMWIGAGIARDDIRPGGLFVSTDEGATFVHTRDDVNAVTCLDVEGERLWLCANLKPNTGGIWRSDDDAETLTEYLTFDDVQHELVCDADAEDPDGGVCTRLWADWVYEQTGAFPTDAGAAERDAGSDGVSTADGGLPDGATENTELADAAMDDGSAEPPGTDGDASPEEARQRKNGGCSVQAPASAAPGWAALLTALSLGAFVRRARRARTVTFACRGG